MRLIDADAIEHCLVIGGRRHGKTIISEIIYRAIQTEPTVDAVPVIRCKECKHYADECCDRYADETLGYVHSTQEYGYCWVAERKEE